MDVFFMAVGHLHDTRRRGEDVATGDGRNVYTASHRVRLSRDGGVPLKLSRVTSQHAERRRTTRGIRAKQFEPDV